MPFVIKNDSFLAITNQIYWGVRVGTYKLKFIAFYVVFENQGSKNVSIHNWILN